MATLQQIINATLGNSLTRMCELAVAQGITLAEFELALRIKEIQFMEKIANAN